MVTKIAKLSSYEFRQKVIAAIEMNGRKQAQVSEMLNFFFPRHTIDLWLKRKQQTGAAIAK